ncbi:MAG: hypothetical protein HC923_09170 [Myxococcales bacterium]|nr:hypothetical protein [Myxococcales bacterium]
MLEPVGRACGIRCPADCQSNGSCNTQTGQCGCALGYEGDACAECASGYSALDGSCVLVGDGAASEWPNEFSRANSDPWIIAHHDEIEVLKPRVLVLDYVNVASPAVTSSLIDRLFAAYRESSRHHGYDAPGAKAQLEWQLAAPIVNLRDGANGRPPPPANYPFENSSLFPRRPEAEPGYWRFDYATLFEPSYAQYLGFEDPDTSGQYLPLCELVERGLVHEVWVVGSGDVPDAGMAEVLEHKPRYTSTGNRIRNAVEPCAANGCYDPDVPFCGRTLRVGFVNYNRGPGCYLHSQGHGLEWMSRSRAVPSLSEWFQPFANMDLDARHSLPFNNYYDLSCATPPCIGFPATDHLRVEHAGIVHDRQPFDAICGNVHFPPNGRSHYDYGGVAEVASSCASFGRGGGALGEDRRELVNRAAWVPFHAVAPDCGGDFLVWWYQNMPAHGSNQVYVDGRPMKAMWPFLYW